MESEKSLYIKILVWAYSKQESGFTWKEMEDRFNLNTEQIQWVLKIFRSNIPASENLIDHLSYNTGENVHKFYITAKGVDVALNYLNFELANKASQRAEIIARVSIVIGVVVGIAQILIK